MNYHNTDALADAAPISQWFRASAVPRKSLSDPNIRVLFAVLFEIDAKIRRRSHWTRNGSIAGTCCVLLEMPLSADSLTREEYKDGYSMTREEYKD